MTDRTWSEEELATAIERLSDPEQFREAEAVVVKAAPDLQGLLVDALGSGGWFGESHLAETLKAATIPDEEERLTAVRGLLTEETHMGMMVGVAVGWTLHRELQSDSAASPDPGVDRKRDPDVAKADGPGAESEEN